MSPSTDHGGNPPVPDSALSAADKTTLRDALAQLHDDLGQARKTLGSSLHEAELKEANARLVVAALRADAIAETALEHLSELARSAYRDTLTGTPNRLLMRDHLDSAIALARREHGHFAVFFIDFDHFRQINRMLGHAVGDEVLRLGAQRLGSVIRATDTLSRQGGDEFLALISQLHGPEDAARVARKMLAALAQPAEVAGHRLALSASIGIAIYPEDGTDAASLMEHADAAMYTSKSACPGSFRFFHGRGTSSPSAAENTPTTAPVSESSNHDQLREANAQLVIAALRAQTHEEQLLEAQQQQTKFVAMVAHELRHPLTPLKLAADMLASQDGHDHASTERLQGIITQQVSHLSRVIGDLLDGTCIHAGKLVLRRKPVDMVAVLRQSCENCQPLLTRRQQTLRLALPPGRVEFNGDPVRLNQIFGNLLDNASKYTPKGGEIALELVVRGDALEITVSDTGIGIAPDALEAIFGLFVQHERGAAFAQGGIGIGLAVVRELVQAHGGTVVVHSAGANMGSRFIVTLPNLASNDAVLSG
ncbi:diguanylate cyclase [Dyella ginsengisoli]|uniref:histidine kinase n=1 Tax=Dyella ginsengisoli TaxID=363848 RepID=A0ABW8JR24_9GAMM